MAQLSLIGHSADVTAVMQALLERPVIARRIAALWGTQSLSTSQTAWLLLFTALHDAGKTGNGFQSGPFVESTRHGSNLDRGHVLPMRALLDSTAGRPEALELRDALLKQCGLDKIKPLLSGQTGWWPWVAALAHHGDVPQARALVDPRLWKRDSDYDPGEAMAALVAAIRTWLPAWPDLMPLHWNFRLAYGFAGLLTLADWLGSDTDIFPLAGIGNAPDGAERFAWALARARQLLQARHLAPETARAATRRLAWTTGALFGFAHASPAQAAMLHLPDAPDDGRVCLIEDETGSGKTEAALIHFLRLFDQGVVDALYFALPTRAAAVQIHQRIAENLRRIWGDTAPPVVLAVPGYIEDAASKDAHDQRGLPPETGLWPDGANRDDVDRAWAAQRPKRYLAAFIAVGTIDQTLMGALKVKHAPLRSASLLRSLLVVDEVHSSDDYMRVVLGNLLDQHLAAGGHALLMSATLGSTARSRLLSHVEPPPLAQAAAVPYPAIWQGNERWSLPQVEEGRRKTISIEISHDWNDHAAVAARAVQAARRGARVLVIRNQVRDVLPTQMALLDLAPDLSLNVNGIAAPHHARFAAADRKLLDHALESLLGAKMARSGGCVVVASQTAEQSLDIDADFLITDLCPADILLQRIGRLHRARARSAVLGFEQPYLLVLAPSEAELANAIKGGEVHNPPLALGLVYPDLLGIVATRRALEEGNWTIPADNRRLVEQATNISHLEALAQTLGGPWPGFWRSYQGKVAASGTLAKLGCLAWGEPMEPILRELDRRITTRLGLEDHFLELPPGTIGPFGKAVGGLTLPGRWLSDARRNAELQLRSDNGGLWLALADLRLRYDALGLRTVPKD